MLRSLREDTLLIVDNFNVTASQDQFLDVILKYRCRILFTTRSRYENHISLEVGELNPDTMLELVGKFFPEAERKQDEIKEIVALLHRHTFARTFYGIEKDIAKLADILGHSSINTTRIYIMTTGTEHRRKIERLGLVV